MFLVVGKKVKVMQVAPSKSVLHLKTETVWEGGYNQWSVEGGE